MIWQIIAYNILGKIFAPFSRKHLERDIERQHQVESNEMWATREAEVVQQRAEDDLQRRLAETPMQPSPGIQKD